MMKRSYSYPEDTTDTGYGGAIKFYYRYLKFADLENPTLVVLKCLQGNPSASTAAIASVERFP